MKFSTFFSRQAKKPSGLFGRYFMSRVFEKGNAEINSLVFEALSVRKNDQVLEVGFGTGALLHNIAGSLEDGLVEGIDFSELMVAIARKKNRRHIENGKVRIHYGDFDDTPLADNSFDKVFSVNTVYFWKRPEATIDKIHRLLKPGGRMLIGFHDKSEMENSPLNKDIFKYYSTADIKELLSSGARADNVEIVSRKKEGQKTCYCAIATKSKAE